MTVGEPHRTSGGQALTVTQVTSQIKGLIESQPGLRGIWVAGEISNYTAHTSGHHYFSLKDERSVISCVMFRAGEKLRFTPQGGQHVLIRGDVTVYPPRGNYQIVVSEMTAEGTGSLYLRFIQLKNQLTKEGLFDPRHKKPLPEYPRRIGLVTSPTGAAVRDILRTLRQLNPCVEVVVYPALVQGEGAAATIVRGIEVLNTRDIDVIIIARGGGSLEDLWAFNEEAVVRAIFASGVPIVSAVGHETDFTLADAVADERAATPTAGAILVVRSREELCGTIAEIQLRMAKHIKSLIINMRQDIDFRAENLSREIRRIIGEKCQELKGYPLDLSRAMDRHLSEEKSSFTAQKQRLAALDPFSVLRRGYTVTMKDGKMIRSVTELSEGEAIVTAYTDGESTSEVKALEVKNHGK